MMDDFNDEDYNDDELNEFLENLNKKFEKEPQLESEVQFMVDRLSEIFENEVNINVNVNGKLEEYKKALISYDSKEFTSETTEMMNVGDLIEILNDEDKNLNLAFDPIHLKEGINHSVDMYVTTFEDKLILVPVTNKE